MPEQVGVLVVDDEAEVRRLIAHILRSQGHVVVEAADGELALERLRERSFDLVITDVRMPKMNGLTLLERCRELYPETDIIVLTAYGTIPSAVHAMQRGASDYLTKPFNVSELEQKVAICLDRRRARAEEQKKSPIEPLVELNRIVSAQGSLQETLDELISLMRRTFEPQSIRVQIFEGEQQDTVVAQYGEALPLAGGRCSLGRTEMQRLAQRPEPWILCTDDSVALEQATVQSGLGIVVPLVTGGETVGALTIARAPEAARYVQADAQLLQLFAFQTAIFMLQTRTRQRLMDAFRNLRQATLATVETLFAALETYDQYTHDHSERVSRFASLLGARLGLASEELETLRVAALLHDIGKLGVGDDTLHKNGSLTMTELDRVKLHPVMGARILAGLPAFTGAVPIVLYHHERCDGTGYPEGLKGDDIPVGARVCAVVDTFDSITSNRPYRAALSVAEALARLREGAGSQLDSTMVEAWQDLVEAKEVAL